MKAIAGISAFDGDGRWDREDLRAFALGRRKKAFAAAWSLVIFVLLPAYIHAQPQERRQYVPFTIDPDYEKILRDRLKMEKELGPLKDLIKQIAADPSKFNEKQLKDLKLNDPSFQKALGDWAASDPQLRDALREWIRQNPPDKQPAKVKQFQQELKKLLDDDKHKIDAHKPKKGGRAAPKVEPDKAKPDSLAKSAERVMKQAENSKLGDWLRDSPAWRRAFADLRTSVNRPEGFGLKLGSWHDQLRLPEGKLWKLGEGTLGRIQSLPRPNLQRFTPSLPGIGNISTPNVPAPELPTFGPPWGGSLPAVGSLAIWILLLVLLLLAAWQLMRWRRGSAGLANDRVRLGSWPVRPESVATRSELVQAFNYLALLTLGPQVQSWNHHAIERSWREKAPACAQMGSALALLYEQARYTEGVEALTDSQRDQARASLRQLAEALA
jgi:hypothetical protein